MMGRCALAIAALVLLAGAAEMQPAGAGEGGPAVDPTENVKALTAAGLKTQEELRIALKELLQAKLDAIEKLNEERYKSAMAMGKIALESAVAERNSELRRIDQIDKLRAEMNDKLAAKEQDRINAMRLLDVGAAADLQRRTSDSATA
jgi:hypothetical protein